MFPDSHDMIDVVMHQKMMPVIKITICKKVVFLKELAALSDG
jgi:hypothetical protein